MVTLWDTWYPLLLIKGYITANIDVTFIFSKNSPVYKSSFAKHHVKFGVDFRPGFSDSASCCQHTYSSLCISYIRAWYTDRRLPVDAYFKTCNKSTIMIIMTLATQFDNDFPTHK